MRLFVTGTDTGVGKTFVSAALAALLRSQGRRVAGMKPVAAGTDQSGRNEDVAALGQVSEPDLPADALNPYCLAAPTAPSIAARREGRHIEVQKLDAAWLRLCTSADDILVEGAGGWRVPIAPGLMMSDLARRWNLPVLLVAGIRLGAINHTLLSLEAMQRDGCRIAGWLANHVDPDYPFGAETVAAIAENANLPCLGYLPWAGAGRAPARTELEALLARLTAILDAHSL